MPESRPNDEVPRLRIAFCHLESLVCLPGLNALFSEIGEQIGLVVLSRRFGARHGGLLTQLRRGIRRSGWRMTLWLGFDIVSAQIASVLAAMTAPILGRKRPLHAIRSLASRYGARVIEVADVNDAGTIATVSEYAPDLVVVFNFDQILKPAFIDVAASGVINVHPSLLPAFRGPCPVFWALAEGCHETGVSIHAITNADIDAGPVVRQQRRAMDRTQSAAEITSALFVAGARLLPDVVRQFAAGGLRSSPQQGSPGDYHGFPAPGDVARAARQGIRLCRAGFVLRLFAAAIGRVGARAS
ncbi:MAG: formyltransferase family protein [Reyranella sp.]|nr:formyltransferase family protein [Reyranella sp.]